MPRTGKMIERAGTLDPYSGYTSVKDDPEFVSRIKSLIGKPFESAVNPSVAANVRDPKRNYSVLGENFYGTTPEEKQEEARHLGLAALPEGKHIFGIGAGANPTTWSHEFRHDKIGDEATNRAADLVYGSTSRDAYVANVERLWRLHKNFEEDTETPFADREKYALRLAHGILSSRPEYRVDNIKPDIARHISINREGTSPFAEAVEHPVESLIGDKVDTEMGRMTKSTAKERAAYPFLLFAGREDLPRSKHYGGASLGEEVEKPKAKKRGGTIENTTHNRKIL